MTPMQCASLMMRNHADPGLIVAYLRLELERDPRIAMRPNERFLHDLGVGLASAAEALRPLGAQLGQAFAALQKAFRVHAAQERSHYMNTS